MSAIGTVSLHVQQGDCSYYSTVSDTLNDFLTLDLKGLMEAADSEGRNCTASSAEEHSYVPA